MTNTKLVTSAYYNIEGHPHYGVDRGQRIKQSLPNIARNTGLPIVCYTSKKYGCYDELQKLFDDNQITNVVLKVFELEEHPLHQQVLTIRLNNQELNTLYQRKPLIVYWSKFQFVLNEMNESKYYYWVDAGLSHNGLFPKRHSIGNTSRFGMSDASCTYNFSCFSQQAFENINSFTQNKVLHVVRPTTDADVNTVITIPELQSLYDKPHTYHWPVGGMFGGHAKLSPLKQYLEKMIELFKVVVNNDRLTVDEGVMAYVDIAYSEWFKKYHFENFYTEDEITPYLHFRADGSIYHHFYRLFCDNRPLIDYVGNQ